MLHRQGSVPMPSDGLGPEAERAFRAAASARVERDVGMQQIANEVVADGKVALIDVHDKGQRVHVLEGWPVGRMANMSIVSVAEAEDRAERPAMRNLPDGEVEFIAGDELDGLRRTQGTLRIHRHVSSDEANAEVRVIGLQSLGNPDVIGKGRGARVEDGKLVLSGERADVLEGEPVGRRIDQPRARDQRRRLGEPRRIPERSNLAARLIAGARAPVEPLVGWRVEEKGPEVRARSVSHEMSLYLAASLDYSRTIVAWRAGPVAGHSPRGSGLHHPPARTPRSARRTGR